MQADDIDLCINTSNYNFSVNYTRVILINKSNTFDPILLFHNAFVDNTFVR